MLDYFGDSYTKTPATRGTKHMHHYYGDLVRKLFLAGGSATLLLAPLFAHVLGISILYPLAGAILVVFVAGVVNPVQKITAVLNTLVAGGSIFVFEWYAVAINTEPLHFDIHQEVLFWLSHLLALNFLVAFYFSTKTLRGMLLKNARDSSEEK